MNSFNKALFWTGFMQRSVLGLNSPIVSNLQNIASSFASTIKPAWVRALLKSGSLCEGGIHQAKGCPLKVVDSFFNTSFYFI